MKKNMYSLILSEEIIRGIDSEAARLGLSRSGLINDILAEYIKYRTPEMRVRDMFDRIQEIIDSFGVMAPVTRSSGSMLGTRSMLSYKYNPAVNYSVELFRTGREGIIGEIRVSLRTQSEELRYYMECFYAVWAAIEEKYLKRKDCSFSGTRMVKEIRNLEGISEDDLCIEISQYINTIDKALKYYFRSLNDRDTAAANAESVYRTYLEKCSIPL